MVGGTIGRLQLSKTFLVGANSSWSTREIKCRQGPTNRAAALALGFVRTKQIPLRYQELQIPSAFIITLVASMIAVHTYLGSCTPICRDLV